MGWQEWVTLWASLFRPSEFDSQCLPLGLAPALIVKTWFGDGMVELE